MISSTRHSIIVSLIGDIEIPLLKQVRNEISRVFEIPTETVPLLSDVEFAFNQGRGQYHSTMILEKLAVLAPSHAIKVLAIVKVDLYIPILTHVYGEAQLGGKACMVSTFRLMEKLPAINSLETFHQRTAKEAVHELGHAFNLRHCRDKTCIMHYCRSIEDVDQKSDQLCHYCRVLLKDAKKRILKA